MRVSLINNQNMELNASLSSEGYKFCPSNSALFQQFLLPRITKGYYQPGIIHELDVYRYQPWDLPGMNMEECEAYYFTPRSKKHPNGKRPNRVVTDDNQAAQFKGFWKMSLTTYIKGQDGILLGKKNLLNYFNSSSVKTEWKMHEYVLDACRIPSERYGSAVSDEVVLCRIYARDNRSRLGGQGRTQMPQSSGPEGLDQQISSTVETSEQRPKKPKKPAASSNQKEQEQCNQGVLGLAAASMTQVEQERLSAGHPIITQARQRIPFAPERDADPTQLPSVSSYDLQEQYNKQALYAAFMRPVGQTQPLVHHSVPLITKIRRQVPLAAEPQTQQPLPPSYHQLIQQSNERALFAALMRPVEQNQPLVHHSVPLITQIRRQVPLAAEPQTQQPLPSNYDQQKQSNNRALVAEPLTHQPLPSNFVQQEQFNMRALAVATMTSVEQEQPSFAHPVPALITHVRRQVSLVAEPPIQVPLPSSYNDQQEPSNYKQATQPVGRLPLHLAQSETKFNFAEELSQILLSDHDNQNYSDLDSEISFLDNFNGEYNQDKNLI